MYNVCWFTKRIHFNSQIQPIRLHIKTIMILKSIGRYHPVHSESIHFRFHTLQKELYHVTLGFNIGKCFFEKLLKTQIADLF